jgi:uncharacterized protein YjbI with pentapeptide repeats
VAEGFTCDVDKEYRSACEGLDFYYEHEGKRYCVLHFPGEKNKEDLLKAKKRKLDRKDYDFGGTVFPEGTADFERFEFDTETYFTDATFIGGAQFRRATFRSERTNFDGAQFSGGSLDFARAELGGERTSFAGAQFSGRWTSFAGAQFSGELTYFYGAQFSGGYTDFSRALFRSPETDFQEATFVKEVDFAGATFSEKVAFWGSKANPVFGYGAWAWFNNTRIEKPEQFTFNTVLLHPCWFINADVRKVDFTDVAWYGMPGGPEGTLNGEIDALKKRGGDALEKRGVGSPYTLLAQTCRRLSANAEENREYPLANEFHYWSLDTLRKENWRRFGLIRTMYWALSGYGVRAARAFWALVVIWAAFATFYVFVDPIEFKHFGQGLGYLWQTAVYSLLALTRLNPEPRPDEPGLFQFLVGLEGILGPLQIALLALAIRRKVMR